MPYNMQTGHKEVLCEGSCCVCTRLASICQGSILLEAFFLPFPSLTQASSYQNKLEDALKTVLVQTCISFWLKLTNGGVMVFLKCVGHKLQCQGCPARAYTSKEEQ